MKRIFRLLPAVCLLLMLSACSKDNDTPTPPTPAESKGNVAFDLDAEVIEGEDTETEEKKSTASRGFDVEALADRARPQITASVGDLIDAHLFFAYTDKAANRLPTNIQTTAPIPTQFKVKEVKGSGNNRQIVLQIREKDINIPQYTTANKNKMWYVCGVIGGELKDGTLRFDPNTALIGGDTLSVGTKKKKLQVPYTFGWQAIKFTERTLSNGTKRESFYIKDAKFYPRGLFLRVAIKNSGVDRDNRPWGSYTLQKFRVKENTDYAPRATFSLQATAANLTSTGMSGFKPTTPGNQEFDFKYSLKEIDLGTDDWGNNLGKVNVRYYENVVGRDRFANNPELEKRRRVKSGYFWVWMADLKADAKEVPIDIIGNPLGLLRPRQSFVLKNLKYPTGKTNVTLARDLSLSRVQLSYIPLEYVARGNATRNYVGGKMNLREVDNGWTYPGAAQIGLWLGGGSFGAREIFTWDGNYGGENLRIKGNILTPTNRYVPTVDDWRTVVPHFREDVFQAETETHKEQKTRYYEYWNGSSLVVDKIFGRGSKRTFGTQDRKDIEGLRAEYSLFRKPDGSTPTKEWTQAQYKVHPTNPFVYYGIRHIRDRQNNFYERRRYCSAYRVESTDRGLIVQAYYIGTEGSKEADGQASWITAESNLLNKIANEDFWKQKMADGEVIERKFPVGGLYRVGTVIYDDFSRYHIQNLRVVWEGPFRSDTDFSMFMFRKDFGTAFLGKDDNGTDALNCLLRFFVIDPQQAYYEWGSRN